MVTILIFMIFGLGSISDPKEILKTIIEWTINILNQNGFDGKSTTWAMARQFLILHHL